MKTHPKARLGLAGRHAMVAMIRRGDSMRAAARTFNVSPATAHKWFHRHRLEGSSGLQDRSCRPHSSPAMLAAKEQRSICKLRRKTGWGPRLIAGETGHPHSTVHRALRRHGICRASRPKRELPNRYEWPCPEISCIWTPPATPASSALATG